MKKIILLLLATTCVILLNAQPKTSPYQVRTLNEVFEKIIVGKDVKVILTEGTSKDITIMGRPEVVLAVENAVLSVKKKICCRGGIPTLYIPVWNIKSIELSEGSSAFSTGQLQSESLTVWVKGASYFELKSKGMIHVNYDESLELDVRHVRNGKLLEGAEGK